MVNIIAIQCPICRFKRIDKLIKWDDNYEIYVCNRCNLLFTFPLPTDEELTKYYQGFLFQKPTDENINELVKRKKKELTKLLKPFPKNKRTFLDYGGGTGTTSQAAKELGFVVYYYDIDENSRDFVKKFYDFKEDKIIKTHEDFKGKMFDYIMCDNVIEHATNPLQFTSNLFILLEEGGTLIIKTPNAGNTEFIFFPIFSKLYLSRALKHNSFKKTTKTFLKRQLCCDPPRHLYVFSRNNILLIARILGLSKITIKYHYLPAFRFFYYRKLIKFNHPKDLIRMVMFFPIFIMESVLKLMHMIMKSFFMMSPSTLILIIKK